MPICFQNQIYNEIENICEDNEKLPTSIIPECGTHGRLVNNVTCECDAGWMTTEEGLVNYTMCDTEIVKV
jgi:hypothetical protein